MQSIWALSMKDDFFVLLSGSRLSLQYLHDDDDEAVRALIYCTENEISDIVVLSSVQFSPQSSSSPI